MAKHTLQELQILQSLPLSVKIEKTKLRIKEWVEEYGIDGVYISFSGGKDSTVLLDIARKMYPNIKAVFIDTGLEYPEIRQFVKNFDNVDVVKPKMNFKEVIHKYGYPFISKEVSNNVDGAKKYLRILTDRQTDRQTDPGFRIPTTIEEYAELANILNKDWGKTKGSPQRVAIILGMLSKTGKAIIPNHTADRSQFSMRKYEFLLESPFDISDNCCNIMKKSPANKYERKTGRKPIIATMATESRLRTQKWLQFGCNSFNSKHSESKPMSFWTEQDVLLYIYENNIPIASVYGEIVKDYKSMGQLDGQMDMSELSSDLGVFDIGIPILKTTGCKRTGCMFCGFGAHIRGDDRFVRMKETHPKQYDYIMRPCEQGGLNYKEVIDWINEHGNLNIKY